MADNNLSIYESVRRVPDNAMKPIAAGRLKGKTDINPMWRIKTLTEQFGPCGIGWKYTILDKRLEYGGNKEIAVFVDIELYIKYSGEWSEPIPGTGGAMFVANEKSGLYTSDECFKMALTDAISVSCKALGIGADVYWGQDATKYEGNTARQEAAAKPAAYGTVPASRGTEQRPATATQAKATPQVQNKQWAPCPVCHGPMTAAEQKYSMNKYGRELCRACQKSAAGT